MTVYLDASVLVAFWLEDDALTDRASTLMRRASSGIIISDFASAEFASAIARHVRTGSIQEPNARAAFADFDEWKSRVAEPAMIEPADVAIAASLVRRLDLNLRVPDAIHLAMAGRLRAELATFDQGLAHCASIVGQSVFAS